MSRDKCGAADVAGFFKIVSILKPKNVKVRNNILILYKFQKYCRSVWKQNKLKLKSQNAET